MVAWQSDGSFGSDSAGASIQSQRYAADGMAVGGELQINHDTPGSQWSPSVAALTGSGSGLLWFFQAENWEMLIKVLDGCAINDRLWVFAAATTNVEYTLRVTDTRIPAVREYHNELHHAADAITDTAAFDACPAGCDNFDAFLFIGAATTDVGYTLTITDMDTGASWQEVNPPGTPSRALIRWLPACQ